MQKRPFQSAIAVRLFQTACLLSVAALCAQSMLAEPPPRFDFKGKLLVVACDGDMLPSAYLDGKLGTVARPDKLAIIRVNGKGTPSALSISQIAVTNSVTGPPAAVATTPDGHYAVVAETQGPRPAGKPDATMQDLAPGKHLTVVDLSDPDRPKVTQQINSYERAVSVAFDETGSMLLVAFSAKRPVRQPPIAIFRFHDGQLSNPQEPSVPGFVTGDQLNDAEWVPGKNAIALLFATPSNARLSFLQYTRQESNNILTLQPWGEPVELDRSPFLVKFTPDGRFALVNSMYGIDVRGTLTSIRIAEFPTGQSNIKTVQHTIVSHTEAGELPEGLAISPDGRWVATANLEGGAYPLTDNRQRLFASVSLLRFHADSGRLEHVREFPFDGLLPEPIVFDNSSRFLAVGSFAHYDDGSGGGQLHFWRIIEDNDEPGRVELIKLDDSVALPRGPQSIAIVR